VDYCLLAVEGPHDQAAIAKLLEISGFKKFKGDSNQLDPFWNGFIPIYPKNGDLYKRMDMPSVLTSTTQSVAIYVGGGSDLPKNINSILYNYEQYAKDIKAFGLIIDADLKKPKQLAVEKALALHSVLPMLSDEPGVITGGSPRTGIYILPDNKRAGVLDSMLLECASVVYPHHKEGAEKFLDSLAHVHNLRSFKKEKALVASIVSILRPGMANTSSIAQDGWISRQTIDTVKDVALLYSFLKSLIGFD